MAKTYPEEAIELCRRLYCKYGGGMHDLVEREMRKAGWAGWTRNNLYDRGRVGTRNERMGWITRYGFERSLQLHIEKLAEGVNGDEQSLYLGIKRVRETLETKVHSGKASKDEVYQYRDFCKLEIDARKVLDLSRDNLETFVAGYEKQMQWAPSIDVQLAKLLVKYTDRFAELAKAHYGKSEADNRGAGDRENEGGGEPHGGDA